jgi:hypothetical protein
MKTIDLKRPATLLYIAIPVGILISSTLLIPIILAWYERETQQVITNTTVLTQTEIPNKEEIQQVVIHATGYINTGILLNYSDPSKSIEVLTNSFYKYNGTLEGLTVTVETLQEEVRPWGGTAIIKATFAGSVNGSEPGCFTAIINGRSNPSPNNPTPLRATFEILKGSGYGSLEGICGKGEIVGLKPETQDTHLKAVYDFQIQLEGCESE